MEELLRSVPRNPLEAILLLLLLFYVKMKSTVKLIWMGTIEKKVIIFYLNTVSPYFLQILDTYSIPE